MPEYLFAGFVFVLIVAVVFINDRLRRSRAGQEDAVRDRERRLFSLYQNLEDLVSSIEEFVAESKQEMGAEKAEMAQMLSQMQALRVEMEAAALGVLSAPPQEPHRVPEPERALFPVQEEPPKPVKRAPAQQPHSARRAPEPETQAAELRSVARAKESTHGKAGQVRRLHEQGRSTDEIAQALAMSRGEVALILGFGAAAKEAE